MTPATVVQVMTSSWPLLAATHFLAFAAGAATVYWLAQKMGTTLQEDTPRSAPKEGPVMPNRLPRSTRVIIYLLVASMVVIGIGVQALLNQRLQERELERDRARQVCIQDWAVEFVRSVDARTNATIREQKAERRLTNAERTIFLTVLALRRVPPEATARQFDRALERYAVALDNLEDHQAATKKTRKANPYAPPALACD